MRANGARSRGRHLRRISLSVSITVTADMLASAVGHSRMPEQAPPELTTGQLAAMLQLPLYGDRDRRLAGAAVLEEAGPEHLAFAGGPKFFEAAARSAAGCIIAPPEFTGANGQTVIASPQPRAHFAQALTILYPVRTASPGIHASVCVEEGASVDPTAAIGPYVTIGRGARIGAHAQVNQGCSIGAGVQIGDCSVFYSHVSVYDRVVIGSGCIIHSGAVIGADGFGFEMSDGAYRKVPQVGTVEIGDDVEIGANCCIDRATLGATVIGEGTKLDNMVHIAHNCRIGRHVVIAAQTGLAGGVSIGDYAVVGGQVGVGDKARIEAQAIIGSGAGILTSKIVRAGEPVWGTPARPLRQYLEQLATLARLSKRRR
jgi:UDP-3-O-[3-hydroxymyristoyl] glucosamine N-acyltransferase